MEQNQKEETQDATPPYFSSWRPIYWIVVVNIVVIIILLQLFFSSSR